MTINSSKGLLGTSGSIHSGGVSVARIKAYPTSQVKDLESKVHHQKIKKYKAGSAREERIPAKNLRG
jgi:hypothetical protein